MSDPHGHGAEDAEAVDGELNVRAIVGAGVGTVVVTIVSMILVWWLVIGMRKLENAEDPTPSALPEAAERMLPPSPRLEISPPANLKELRAQEDETLDHPAWIDQAGGKVRLPIDLAIDVVARRGLGGPSAEAPVEASPTATEGAAEVAPATPDTAPAASAGGAH